VVSGSVGVAYTRNRIINNFLKHINSRTRGLLKSSENDRSPARLRYSSKEILSAATVALPTMQYNTTSTSGLKRIKLYRTILPLLYPAITKNNITVGTNCNVTLKVPFWQYRCGFKVLLKFTQAVNVIFTGITLRQVHPATTSTRLAFAGSTVVKSTGQINVATRCI